MAATTSRIVTYETDTGEELQILIRYETSLQATVRFTDGGFGTEDQSGCSPITVRRKLKPRFIIKRYGTGASATEQRVYVKNPSTFNTLINQDTTVRYCGECFCPSNN